MKPPTGRSESFLLQYRRYGGGLSIGQFCRRQGFSKQSVDTWIEDTEGFRESYEAIQRVHSGSPETTEAGMQKFGLTREQADFLQHYGEHRKRVLALDQIGWTTADFMDAMKNPIFNREWELLRQRVQWIVEDSLETKAIDGSLGHQKLVLEAMDPERYAKKINHRLTGNVQFTPKTMENRRQFWAQRLAGALPPAPAEDAVDAEYSVAAD